MDTDEVGAANGSGGSLTIERQDVLLSQFLGSANSIEDEARRVIRLIPQLSDANIEELGFRATDLGNWTVIIRGACAHEAQNRVATRLTGGRGKVDVEGVGVKQHLARLAARWGVGLSTIYDDIRIYERVFAPRKVEDPETGQVHEVEPVAQDPGALPRDWWGVVASSDDPEQAAEIALDNYGRKGFTAKTLASVVKAKDGKVPAFAETPARPAEDMVWINDTPITQSADQMLRRIMRVFDLPKSDTIERCIRETYDRLREEGMVR